MSFYILTNIGIFQARTLFRQGVFTSPSCNRWQNVKYCSTRNRGVKTLQIANIFTVQEDIDKRAQLTCFVTQVEAHTRKIMIERIDNLTNSAPGRYYSFSIANLCAQCYRKGNVDSRQSIQRIHHNSFSFPLACSLENACLKYRTFV